MDKELAPTSSSGIIIDLLRSTNLMAFAEPMAEYGFETLSDLDHFNDAELQHEFRMSPSEVQRLRTGAVAQAARQSTTNTAPSPPRLQPTQQSSGSAYGRPSASTVQMASAWGMADEEMELAALMAKSSSLTPEEVARAQDLMRQQKHTYVGRPPPPPEFKARVLLEETRAKASAAAANASALAATTTAAAARNARVAAARGSAAAESFVLGPGQRRWSLNSINSNHRGVAATMPSAPLPANLEAFLEVHGLGQFSAAMNVFGIASLSDLADGSPFDDDDTCRDIGMDSVQIRALRDAITKIPALLSAPPPIKAEPSPEEVPSDLGDEHFGAYAYDDSGLMPRNQQSLKSSAKGAAKATRHAFLSATSGRSKTAPPRGTQKSKYWVPGDEDDDDSDEDLDLHTAIPPPFNPSPPTSMPTPPSESASANFLVDKMMAPSSAQSFEEAAPLPRMPSVLATSAPAPVHPPVDVARTPAPLPQPASLPTPSVPPASKPSSEAPALPPPPLDPRLEALPKSDRPKVEQQVAAVLAECQLPPQEEMVDVLLDKCSNVPTSLNKSWAMHAVARLSEGTVALSSRESAALQRLGMYRATNKCFEELHACDSERKTHVSFSDNQLVSHEPQLLRFHQDFTLIPLQRTAQCSYPEALQTLLTVRVKAKRARGAIGTLQADIASKRKAGDLDSALLSQEHLVRSFRESIDLAQSSRTATAKVRASLYNLAQALASAGSPDDDDDDDDDGRLLTSEADFWREIGGHGGESQGVAPPFFQQRLHQSASVLQARLARGRHECQSALDLVTTRASELERELLEGPALNLHISSETNTQGVASASSPNEWVAHAHDAARGQEAKARDDEAARVAEFEKLLWEQRLDLEAAIASGDQAAYLKVQAQQLRAKADHWAAEQAKLDKWRQAALDAANVADRDHAVLVQARHTGHVSLELASEALQAKQKALAATLDVHATANVLLEALVARASWLGQVLGARFQWLNRALSEVEVEGLEDCLYAASEQLKWVQMLHHRKTRDLSHLSSRLEQHTQERLNAIERDNSDDVRRADRNFAETTAAQQRAVASLDTTKAQRQEALGELVRCLRFASDKQLLPLNLVTMANEALALAKQESLSSSLPPSSLQAELSAITFHENNNNNGCSLHKNDTNEVARFVVAPSVEEAELLCDVPGCLACGGLPEDFLLTDVAVPAVSEAAMLAPTQAASMQQPRQSREHSEKPASANAAAAAAAAAAATAEVVGNPNAAQEVHVQLLVPPDASVGSYLDASVCYQGVNFPFQVVVPEGAVPGVTYLTVPVPVSGPSMTSAPTEGLGAIPPPPPPCRIAF